MKISKVRIKNYRSIKDSGDILFTDKFFVLAGQNESGKSSVLEALDAFEKESSEKENLNFELENDGNFIQEISVSYSELDNEFYKNTLDEIFAFIKAKNPTIENIELNSVFIEGAINKIQEFTVTRTFDFSNEQMLVLTGLDKSTLGKIRSCINDFEIEETDENNIIKKTKKLYLDTEVYAADLAAALWNNTLNIILFNDFTTLLPDKILLEDLDKIDVEGHEAVKNIGQLLNSDFLKISKKNTPQKNATTEEESAILSANFQEDWQQKIYGNNKVNIKLFIENNDEGKKEISFFIETKDNEFLAPRRRSKGMIWFLSLWLELKAKENSEKLVLLFDEPGLHLHIKANKDMLKVFHKLITKGHQIIYSTHSPSLIETDKLHNIGLVINNEKSGTSVEGLTTSKINSENKKDALQPIAEAMGMEPLKDFSVLKEKNVLLEGLSDYWYFKGMSKLLRTNIDYEFIPGIGIKGNKIYHLISFCLGYGLDWLLLMDNGILPTQVRDELKEELFAGNEDETNKKIRIVPVVEIENIFNQKDLLLIDSTIKEDIKKTPIEIIGAKRKILFSKMFYQKVFNGEITKNQLHADTISQFDEVFKWIENQFAVK